MQGVLAWLLPLSLSAALRIHDVQGAAHRSPHLDEQVELEGVVTALSTRGFYLQDPQGDDDEATSEAVRVAWSQHQPVTVGDVVHVVGVATEPRPDCKACAPSDGAYANLTTTEIAATDVVVTAHGAELPRALGLGEETGERVPPSALEEDRAAVDIEGRVLEPRRYAVDFYESLEAMRIRMDDAVALGPTVHVEGGAELVVAPHHAKGPPIVLRGARAFIPDVDRGDGFATAIDGVLDYGEGTFRVQVTAALTPVAHAPRARSGPSSAGPEGVTLATFNLKNLAPSDAGDRMLRLADIIVRDLGAPDVLALEEVQDDSGPRNDGTVSARANLAALIDSIEARGGPRYEAREIAPEDGRDGGEFGGNIRVALLVHPLGGVHFVDREGRENLEEIPQTTSVELGPKGPRLTRSPSLIEPESLAFEASRKPLAIELEVRGGSLFIVVCHWVSQLGDLPPLGRFQPPSRLSRGQRVLQAEAVGRFVASLLNVNADARVAVLGDLNDVPLSPPLRTLTAAGLTDLVRLVPEADRFTHVYRGDAQVIDHIFTSRSLTDDLANIGIPHVDTDFTEAASDHDPLVAHFRWSAPPAPSSLAGCSVGWAQGGVVARPFVTMAALLAVFERRRRAQRRCREQLVRRAHEADR